MSQVGRPVKGEAKRTIAIGLRISEVTQKQLQDISNKYKVSQADTIISAVDMMHNEIFGEEKGNGEF